MLLASPCSYRIYMHSISFGCTALAIVLLLPLYKAARPLFAETPAIKGQFHSGKQVSPSPDPVTGVQSSGDTGKQMAVTSISGNTQKGINNGNVGFDNEGAVLNDEDAVEKL